MKTILKSRTIIKKKPVKVLKTTENVYQSELILRVTVDTGQLSSVYLQLITFVSIPYTMPLKSNIIQLVSTKTDSTSQKA